MKKGSVKLIYNSLNIICLKFINLLKRHCCKSQIIRYMFSIFDT
jgi:hypothetical protein